MRSSGQAVIEYLLILILVTAIGGPLVRALGRSLGDGAGTLNSVLSSHLSVGVCKEDCFPDSYVNGKGL